MNEDKERKKSMSRWSENLLNKKRFERRKLKRLGKKWMAVLLATALGFNMSNTSFAANMGHTTTDMSPLELENVALSQVAATEGMVLLENKNNALPITKGSSVALFGGGSYATIKGGTGSGDVNQRYVNSIYDGLKSVYTLSSQAWMDNFITNFEAGKAANVSNEYVTVVRGSFGGANSYLANDPLLTQADIDAAKVNGTTTAIYTISRVSGEGSDRTITKGDYYLSDTERANIALLAQAFDKSIVILNVGGIIDTKFFDEITGLDGLFLMSQAGMEGGNALAKVFDGDISPSGKLTDTWAESYSDYPASRTIGGNDSDTANETYAEGVYVGYRYFDTFGITPAYAFGYGLSYTSFDIKTLSVIADYNKVTVKVKVTNTGNTYSGKEVVQVYFSAPAGTIEKPYQELAAFAKTDILAPKQSQELTISYNTTEMSSYSAANACYLMEDGDYILRVGNSSRNTHVAQVLTVAQDVITERLSNQLTQVNPDISSYGTIAYTYPGEVGEISAAVRTNLNFVGFVAPNNASLLDNEIVTTYRAQTTSGSAVTVTGGSITVTGAALTGTMVNVPLVPEGTTLYDVYAGNVTIQQFVASLSATQLANIVNGTSGQIGVSTSTGAALVTVPGAAGTTTGLYYDSLGIPNTVLADGPAGIRITQRNTATVSGIPITYYQFCTAWPIGTALAQTWNEELITRVGVAIGKEMIEYGVSLWLAPGMNIHRDPLCGRNFEYYSEDPFVTGAIGTATTLGVQSNPGVGVTIKHYAGNNQETNRNNVNNIVSERALREIYLKGFEMTVKSAQPMAIMSSYNKNNGKYAIQDYDLLTDLPRGEWGYDGIVMSDWGAGGRASVNTIFHAGNDIVMSGSTQTRLVNSLSGTPSNALDSITALGDVQKCAINVLETIMESNQFAAMYASRGVVAKPYSSKYTNLTQYLAVSKANVETPVVTVPPTTVPSNPGTPSTPSTPSTPTPKPTTTPTKAPAIDTIAASTSDNAVKAKAASVGDTTNAALKAILNDSQKGSVVSVTSSSTLSKEVKITATVADSKAGQKVYIYKVNAKTKKLETFVGGYSNKVNADNTVTFGVASLGTYVILTEAAPAAQITALISQVSVKASNTKLAVGKTTAMKVTLPACLQKVTDLTATTPSAAIGNVMITYKTSDTKVASINANGKITAKKAGTVTIIATIKLYSGKVKTIKTKVTIK
jgi:beta-glucosidase